MPSAEANALVDVVILAIGWLTTLILVLADTSRLIFLGFFAGKTANIATQLEVLMRQTAYTLQETKEFCELLGNDVP